MIGTTMLLDLAVAAIAGGLIPTVKWWIERRDTRSTVATERTEATKTVRTLKESVLQLQNEKRELREDREHFMEQAQYHQLRADRLESEKVAFMERALNAEAQLRAMGAST